MESIVHLTSAHPRLDTRIFLKQCRSLAAAGYEMSLVVADGKGDEVKECVRIFDVGTSKNRFDRIRNVPQRVYAKARSLDADVYHLHDPELLPIGLKLKRRGKKVIFDSHEDVPGQMLSKPYLGPIRLRIIARVFTIFERYACRRLDGVIAATPFIRSKFLPINPRSTDINNFPLLDELESSVAWLSKQPEVCYIGGIAAIRGIREIVTALELTQSSARLNLGGNFSETAIEAEVKALPGWQRVNELGFIDRGGVKDVLGRSVAGLVTFHPLPNHIDAQPNKMFEYMSAGIPVIASNFPLWREIIEGNDCGLCVDPLNPRAIAQAIDDLVANPEKARRMGENGRKAVIEKFNWPAEEKKLLAFYSELLSV